MLALAGAIIFATAGVATAGHSGGGGADNGNKNGTDNKKTTRSCPDGYSLVYTYSYPSNSYGGYNYDLNNNYYVCYKDAGSSGYTFIDDTTSS